MLHQNSAFDGCRAYHQQTQFLNSITLQCDVQLTIFSQLAKSDEKIRFVKKMYIILALNVATNVLPQIAKESNLTKTDTSLYLCDLCHQNICDTVYYLSSSTKSVFDTNYQVLRICGHKFHKQCCIIGKCPVCQKYFNSCEKLHIEPIDKPDISTPIYDYKIDLLKVKCIMRTLYLLSQNPEIDRTIVNQFYHNEVQVMIKCFQSHNHKQQIANTQELYNTEYIEKPPVMNKNTFKNSNFEYIIEIMNEITCSFCNEPFCLQSKTDLLVCLVCGQYVHPRCQHIHKVFYSFFSNTILTLEYGIIGPYKDKFGGLQQDCTGLQMFLDKQMLGQIIYNLITNEALLQQDQPWVYSREDTECYIKALEQKNDDESQTDNEYAVYDDE
ncbi:Zinc_finger domain-containing protein [Hexamita inflata]|uniref:Zinc finger domain-containing protein n=1 Tax=Hexamita inflata TaxID=28002 RepID=A0AA86QHF9_9EUKA|nr:Zinc finger domain-containing protein [Hexamita inflata]